LAVVPAVVLRIVRLVFLALAAGACKKARNKVLLVAHAVKEQAVVDVMP